MKVFPRITKIFTISNTVSVVVIASDTTLEYTLIPGGGYTLLALHNKARSDAIISKCFTPEGGFEPDNHSLIVITDEMGKMDAGTMISMASGGFLRYYGMNHGKVDLSEYKGSGVIYEIGMTILVTPEVDTELLGNYIFDNIVVGNFKY